MAPFQRISLLIKKSKWWEIKWGGEMISFLGQNLVMRSNVEFFMPDRQGEHELYVRGDSEINNSLFK